ncbi:hypothetical protein DCC62_32950 [candidate division KSB1 bacterium]|nr:MAG: hypothetical protein DCC62_32950 [candidate division KSB1 bacterium]
MTTPEYADVQKDSGLRARVKYFFFASPSRTKIYAKKPFWGFSQIMQNPSDFSERICTIDRPAKFMCEAV